MQQKSPAKQLYYLVMMILMLFCTIAPILGFLTKKISISYLFMVPLFFLSFMRYLHDFYHRSEDLYDNKKLAAEYVNTGQFNEALKIYTIDFRGILSNDIEVIEGLCCIFFFKGEYKNAEKALLKLNKLKNLKEDHGFHLLYTRTLDKLGKTDKAIEEYALLVKSFIGEEARCRYALLLQKINKTNEANVLFHEIIQNSKIRANDYIKAEKEWIDIARKQTGSDL